MAQRKLTGIMKKGFGVTFALLVDCVVVLEVVLNVDSQVGESWNVIKWRRRVLAHSVIKSYKNACM